MQETVLCVLMFSMHIITYELVGIRNWHSWNWQ